jgi:MFS family permease
MWDRVRGAIARLRENERLNLILITTVLTMAGQGVMAPVLPVFASHLGVGAAAIGLTLSSFALARLLLNVPLGALSDRRGRRVLLVGGPFVSALGMLGSGISETLVQLLAWRFVAGAGSAMYMTGAQVYLVDISTPANRARVIGANQAALLFGVSIGPAVGGLLAGAFGFRVPFFAVGAASILTCLFAYSRLPETANFNAAGDATGEPSEPRGSGLRRVLTRDFAAVCSVSFAVFLTRAGGRMTLLPLLAMSDFGYTVSGLGGLFALMAAINLAGVGPASWLADRFGRKWVIVPAGIAISGALVAMAGAESTVTFTVSAVALAIGTAALGPAPAAFASDIAPESLRGFAMGLYRSAGDAGFLLGPVLLGLLADRTSIQLGLAANAVVFASATAIFGLVARGRRREVAQKRAG